MYGYDTIAAWATFLDPNKTGVLVIWGANQSESQPRLWQFYKLARAGA